MAFGADAARLALGCAWHPTSEVTSRRSSTVIRMVGPSEIEAAPGAGVGSALAVAWNLHLLGAANTSGASPVGPIRYARFAYDRVPAVGARDQAARSSLGSSTRSPDGVPTPSASRPVQPNRLHTRNQRLDRPSRHFWSLTVPTREP